MKEDIGTQQQAEAAKKEAFSQEKVQVDKSSFSTSQPPCVSVSFPPTPKTEDLEAKFRAWEIDQEIAQMKAEMHFSDFKTNQQQTTNQNKQASNQLKTQVEKDKITRAYSVLGLQPTASLTEIKQAYKTLVKKWHPDLFVGKPQLQQAQKKMRVINEAYTILSEKFS